VPDGIGRSSRSVRCPLTGRQVVRRVHTDLIIFRIPAGQLRLTGCVPSVAPEAVRERTAAPHVAAP
jgi:acyl CoA:acetate/3-ketoacid CoA transferase beta subunit